MGKHTGDNLGPHTDRTNDGGQHDGSDVSRQITFGDQIPVPGRVTDSGTAGFGDGAVALSPDQFRTAYLARYQGLPDEHQQAVQEWLALYEKGNPHMAAYRGALSA